MKRMKGDLKFIQMANRLKSESTEIRPIKAGRRTKVASRARGKKPDMHQTVSGPI